MCLEDWVGLARRKNWNFAGQSAVRTDERWTQKCLCWKPFLPWGRLSGRPRQRWDDDIVKLAGGDWPTQAKNVSLWNQLGEAFVNRGDVPETFGYWRDR